MHWKRYAASRVSPLISVILFFCPGSVRDSRRLPLHGAVCKMYRNFGIAKAYCYYYHYYYYYYYCHYYYYYYQVKQINTFYSFFYFRFLLLCFVRALSNGTNRWVARNNNSTNAWTFY